MTPETTPDLLGLIERLESLREKATEGPWKQGGGGGKGATTYAYEVNEVGNQKVAIVACTLSLVERDFHEREANAALIAETINALPTLLSALRRVAPVVEALGEAIGIIEEGVWVNISDEEFCSVHPEDKRFIKKTRNNLVASRAALAAFRASPGGGRNQGKASVSTNSTVGE